MSGAVLRKSPVESWEEHVEAWHALGRRADGAAWDRAAIAVSLKGRYGEGAVEKFAAEVGFSRAAIYDFARTFEVFSEKSERSDNLSFSHHLLAVRFTSDAAEARAAVALAGREEWSANALRKHLAQPPADGNANCVRRSVALGEVCGPVTSKDKTFHVAALVDSFAQTMSLFEAVESYDVHPLVQAGTKKSLKELSEKIDHVVEWLASLRETIERKIK